MFLKHNDRAVYLDLSTELRDADDWVVGTLKTLEYYLDICALAVEPLAGLLAVGTMFVPVLIQLSSYSQEPLRELFTSLEVPGWSRSCHFQNLCEQSSFNFRCLCTSWCAWVRGSPNTFNKRCECQLLLFSL